MQIRLTVVDPLGPAPQQRGRAARRDVLVTAPSGTALADVASALAAAVAGDWGGAHERGRESGGAVVLYAGAERLDGRRRTLGEPPLTDGAVLFLGAPGEPEAHPETDDAPAQLHVVAGPDAGGVHLLHGGRIRVGRSADAEVPLDDPDVSRLHCAITVEADGRVSVADLDSTNGTLLGGVRVGPQEVRFPPGALLRLGESALRLAPAGGPGARAATAPDGEGHVRLTTGPGAGTGAGTVTPAAGPAATAAATAAAPAGSAAATASGQGGTGPVPGAHARVPHQSAAPAAPVDPAAAAPADGIHQGYGQAGRGAPGHGPGEPPVVPGRGHFPRAGSGDGRGSAGAADGERRGGATRAAGLPGPRTGGGRGTGVPGAEAIGGGRDTPAQGRWTTAEEPGPFGRGAAPEDDPRARTRGTAGDDQGTGSRPGGRAGEAYAPGVLGEDEGTRAQRRRAAGGDAGEAVRTPGRETAQGSAGPAGPLHGRTPATDPRAYDRTGPGTPTGTAHHHGTPGAGPGTHLYDDPASPDADTRAYDRHAPGAHTGPAHRHGTPGTEAGTRPFDDRTGPGADLRARGRGVPGAPTAAGNPPVAHATGPSDASGDGGPAPAPGPVPHPTADASHTARKRGGLSAWARRLAGGKGAQPHETGGAGAGAAPGDAVRAQQPETWPDPAALLLTALGPGPRLWERGAGHPEALTVRLGTADRTAPDGAGLLPAVPVTAALREAGALGLAGPRPRLAGLARSVLAQLTALHSPEVLEVVLLSTDRARPVEERTDEWSWLGWLPHLRPARGQDCRLLVAYDREQAMARTAELLRRLDDPTARRTHGTHDPHEPRDAHDTRGGHDTPGTPVEAFPGPYSVVVVDGDPGGADLREAVARLALEGPAAGIHVLCLAETDPASFASPVTETYTAACAVSAPFRVCGAVALLGGDVATALRLMRVAHGAPVGPGTVAAVDAVSSAWAERFARALAPLRTDAAQGGPHTGVSAPLPPSARLLDELGLARATPASLMARWADAADDTGSPGGRARAVLGAGPRGPLVADLVADGPHLLIEGPPGSGRTELLRAVVASLASAERPDRLGIVLVDGRDRRDGRDGTGTSGGQGGTHGPHGLHGPHAAPGAHGAAGPGDGLGVCTEVPHATTHLTADDPVRMREFAQSLAAELKRRAELLGRADFAEWHTHTRTRSEPTGRIVPQRTAGGRATGTAAPGSASASAYVSASANTSASASVSPANGDLESPPSTTLRLRPPSAARQTEAAPPLPRLVVVVDDLDALVSPALGSPGRPAAGSVLRALDAVAREGERLGVHLVVATGPGSRAADTEPAHRATLRVTLDTPPAQRTADADPRSGEPGDEPAPGRGRLTFPDGRVTAFQGGRVTGRIPRTATLRPTVVALEWQRMGDPPARRQVRELGNGPTDLALLASALERAARSVTAAEVPSLL
ncbi:FHA domain-containing protein [Streptomyces sp. NPDC047000]|uniref:FHA domain-containing protein n=1 Tax=Streptomyces sp. NPDC047000 TaxID=3155474 RepID=UPI0034105EE7